MNAHFDGCYGTTEDGRDLNLLSRDLSATGIRLVGTRRMLGLKVEITIPDSEGEESITLFARVLWTCAVGDDLFENGCRFLELTKSKK